MLAYVARSLTRLSPVFVSLHTDYGIGRVGLIGSKYWNDAYSPMFFNRSETFIHDTIQKLAESIDNDGTLLTYYNKHIYQNKANSSDVYTK